MVKDSRENEENVISLIPAFIRGKIGLFIVLVCSHGKVSKVSK